MVASWLADSLQVHGPGHRDTRGVRQAQLAATGARHSGTDHASAAELLGRVNAKVGTQLFNLVALKPGSHYGHDLLDAKDCTAPFVPPALWSRRQQRACDAGSRRIPWCKRQLSADMKGPERNRRGMQQRSGLLTTISESAVPASASPEVTFCVRSGRQRQPLRSA
jgi:hypothetical protein